MEIHSQGLLTNMPYHTYMNQSHRTQFITEESQAINTTLLTVDTSR